MYGVNNVLKGLIAYLERLKRIIFFSFLILSIFEDQFHFSFRYFRKGWMNGITCSIYSFGNFIIRVNVDNEHRCVDYVNLSLI